MQSIRVQEFSFRITGIIGHLIIDIYKMQVVALPCNFFFDDPIGVANAVHNIPAGDAGLDRDEGKGDIAEALAGAANELLEEDEYFFGMTSVSEIVVAGIDDDRCRLEGGQQPVEEPDAGCEGGAAESQIGRSV